MPNNLPTKNKIYLDVAKLHILCIKKGFLPKLGINFLTLLYRAIDESNFSTLIVRYNNEQCIGFVSGAIITSKVYKKILNHPIQLILSLLPCIVNFKKIKNIIEILKHISGNDRSKYPKPELLTICVHPDHRRNGIALELYNDLSKYFKSKSIKKFAIVVGRSLIANKFYANQGANLIGEIKVHKNIVSNIYIQETF